MNEDALTTRRKMIRTASGLKPMPTTEELEARSRQIAKQLLLEAGLDPATIEDAVTEFLNKPPSFSMPSDEELRAMSASQASE